MSKGRPPIDRELVAAQKRLADVNSGLLACYETIEIGKRKQAEIEAKIKLLRSHASGRRAMPPPPK